eukprot:14525573-Alexandrium_andersonii.AAC.1
MEEDVVAGLRQGEHGQQWPFHRRDLDLDLAAALLLGDEAEFDLPQVRNAAAISRQVARALAGRVAGEDK